MDPPLAVGPEQRDEQERYIHQSQAQEKRMAAVGVGAAEGADGAQDWEGADVASRASR